MKRLVFALALSASVGSAAVAADLPAVAPVPPPVYVPSPPLIYNWTGFYIGGNLGVGWNGGNFSDSVGNSFTPNTSAQFLGGGQVGLNYQFNNGVLVGVEADFDWLANNTNSNTIGLVNNLNTPAPTGSTASATVNNRWLTTLTGRFGWAWDRVLLYGKGGGAWVGSTNPTLAINGAPVAISTNNSNWGWTAGLGAEWAFWGNWSARIEYDFVGLNNQSFVLPASVGGLPAGDQFASNNRNIQMVNVGVNYKFGPWW
jgi:outer membrane immunogenic protein